MISEAVRLAQLPPFNLSMSDAEGVFVPANPTLAEDGITVTSPATLYWCSGQFAAPHWQALQGLAAQLDGAEAHEYDLVENPGYPRSLLAELENRTLASPPSPH